MTPTLKLMAIFVCAMPLAVLAQTTPSSTTTDKAGASSPSGMENKKTTETGQSTTYPKSDATTGMNKSAPANDKEKNKITKGDAKTPGTPVAPMDPATTQKPAKEGSQSGPTK